VGLVGGIQNDRLGVVREGARELLGIEMPVRFVKGDEPGSGPAEIVSGP